MPLQIHIDYDGPSLSDTASLASREDPLEGSQVPFSAGELSSPPPDDDAVTVSSKDTHGRLRQGRAPLIKKFLNGTPRAVGSPSRGRQPQKPSRSRILNFGSRMSSTEEAEESNTQDMRTDARSLHSVADTERGYSDDISGVFERLRLEEQRDPTLPHERSMLQTEIGQAWLKDQSTNRLKATLGRLPSIRDDFSLNTDTPLSDAGTDIMLPKDEPGKSFGSNSGSGSYESEEDLEYEIVNYGQPSKPRYILRTAQSISESNRSYRQWHVDPLRASSTRGGH
jgi:hypothetical protein